MTRLARVVAIGMPHDITQLGNARQRILDSEAHRRVYMDLLRASLQLHALTLMGNCLMSNHVHLIMIPKKADALGRAP